MATWTAEDDSDWESNAALAAAARRLRVEWSEGRRPDPRDFLPLATAAGRRETFMAALLLQEFICRWEVEREPPSVERMLVEIRDRLGNELSPGTATWHELSLDLIWSEIAGSSSRLDFPSPEEADYLDRFPECAEDIRELFGVARELTLAELALVSRLSQTVLESSTARRERRDASLEFDVDSQVPPPRVGDEVQITERWTVTDELGAGGEKLVFRGRQSDTGREATLKFPRVPDKESIARMLGEATTQASIGHPFIPPVFAVSRNAPDQLVLIEQEVRGAPWSEWIGRLDLDENLGVLLKISLALAAAHRRSIIHRDVKPSNVMVTVRERDGRYRADEVALLDWGLAVDVGATHDPDSLTPHKSTVAGRCQGTPLYLAPEMVAMQAERFQPATDVFLLGAVLYEILTGAPPYAGQTTASRPSGDALVLLGFTRVLRAKVLPAHERVPDRDRVPLELSEIASRAMSRDPARRFHDADEFATALQRQVDHRRAERQSVEIAGRFAHLEEEIVVARRRAESLEPYVARCQAIVNEFDLAHRFLASDGGGESLREACEREQRALSRLIDLEIDSGTLELAGRHLDEIATGAHVRIRQLAGGEQEQFRERLASQRAARHRQRVRSALFPAAIVVLLLIGLVMVQRENSIAIERERATSRQRIEELRGKALPLFTTAASDRQQSRHHLAALGQARGLAYIDTPAGRAAWMDDVQSSLVPTGISSRREILGSLAFHPDLDYLFAAGRADGQIRAWSLGDDGGAVLFGAHEVPEDTNGFSVVTGMAVRPERTREVLSTGNDGTLRTWRLQFDGNRLRGAEEVVERRFPSAETKWDARLMCLAIEPARVKGPERRIVLGDDSGRVIWINADSRRVIREQKAHTRAVRVVKYLPTRDECVSAAEDGVVKFWRLNGEPIGAIVPTKEDGSPLGAEIRTLDISPDGRQMAVGFSTGPIWIWDVGADDVDRRRVLHRLPGHDKSERSVAPTPTTMSLVYSGPRRVLSGGTDGLVREWDTEKGRETRRVTAHADTPQGGPLVRNLAVDLRNGRFASFGIDLATVVWDSESLTPRLRTEGQMAPVTGSIGAFSYAFSRQSDRLAIGSYNFDSLIRTFDTGRLREHQAFQGLTVEPNLSLIKRVSALAINEAGDRVVSAEPDGALVLWDAERGRVLGRWKTAHKPVQGGRLDAAVGAGILVSALAWSRDGKRVASLGRDLSIEIHDIENQLSIARWELRDDERPIGAGAQTSAPTDRHGLETTMMGPLRALTNPVFAFTAEDRRLVVAGQDEVVRLVGVASHEIEARLLGHAGAVVSGDLDAKGRTLYTGDERGVICKWNVDSARLSSTFAVVGTARNEHEGGTTPIERMAANYVAYRSSHVLSVAVSRRERLLAAALGDGSIIILDCENGREFARGVSQRSRPRDDAVSIATLIKMNEPRAAEHANRNGFNQSSSLEAYIAHLLDAHPFRVISLLEDKSRANSPQPFLRTGWVGLMWSKSGQLISIASDGHLRRWDLQPWGAWGDGFSSTSVAKRSEALPSGVMFAAAPPAGQPPEWALLVNGKIDRRDGEFRALQGWAPDAKSKDFVQEVRYAMRHGRLALVATTAAGRAVVIDSKDGSQVAEFLGPDGTRKTKAIPNATAIAQADLGRVLAGETDSPKVAIEALAIDPTGEIIATSWEHRAPAKIFGLVDGKVEQHVDLWRISDGRPITDKSGKPITLVIPPTNDGKGSYVTGLAFHPSEQVLAVSDNDGDISIWNWPTRKLLRRFSRQLSPPGRILFSPDGRWLLQCGIGSEVVWWDWSSGVAPPPTTPIRHKSPHAFVQRVVEMAFSADGQWLATSGADDAVRIWDAKTRLPVAVVSLRDMRQMDRKAAATDEFDQGATGLAFSSDNRELLVADGTQLVRRYDLSALRALAKFPASRLNDLTEQVLRGRMNENSFEPTIVPPLMPVVTAKPTD